MESMKTMASFVKKMWWCLYLLSIGICVIECNEHYHNLPYCSPDNLNMMNASHGDFILQNDGSFRYQMRTCKLRKFKVNEAAACLQGQHLLFMGDSLSRYFYLNLAALFAFGKWPLHFVDQYPNGKSFLSEKEYGSWSWFFEDTNLALNQGYHAIEILDSFRNDTQSFDEFIRTMYENRHFRYLPKGNLDDRVHDVRLSYIQWWGSMPMRGHRRISTKIPRSSEVVSFLHELNRQVCPHPRESFYPLTRRCQEFRKDNEDIDFPAFPYKELCINYPNPTFQEGVQPPVDMCQLFERTVLQPMNVTHLLMNIGWHSRIDRMGDNFFPKLVDASEKYFDHPPTVTKNFPRVIWRESTKGAVFEDYDIIPLNFSQTFNKKHANPQAINKNDNNHQHNDAFGYFTVGKITAKLRKINDLWDNKDNAMLEKTVKVNHHWPTNRQVNITTIHRIWHDTAHFEPYVYSEINNLLLNAICPLSVSGHGNRNDEEAFFDRKVKRTKPGELPPQEEPKFAGHAHQ